MNGPEQETPPAPRHGRAPGAWPLLGHLPYLATRPLSFLDSLPGHGDVVRVRMGPRTAHVVSHPALVRRVLTDRRSFDRSGVLYEKVRALLGNGLATCPNAEHRDQRRTLQPAFHHSLMDRYAAVMTAETQALTARWRPGAVVDVTEEAFRLTTAVAVRTLFSAGITAQAAEELREALEVLLRGVYTRVVAPVVDRVPSPARRRYRRALARWRTGVAAIVAAYRAAGVDHGDALSLLLAVRDEHGRALSDAELGDQVATLVLAGAETTSSVLAWALRLLADHPEAAGRLHRELDAVLAGGPVTAADLPRLPYTADVVREVLRLYPPAWAITRTTTRETELAGLPLAPGSTVICCLYLLHRRRELFPDAARFDPDRWAAGEAPRDAWLPFGLGATKCVGDVFGTVEAGLALAAIASRWHLTPVSPRPPRPVPRIVLSPGPQPMRLAGRVPGVGAAGVAPHRAGDRGAFTEL
ncbi:cytochrome P450 [Streptomyces tanashiensis]|uniref:cytochrome P450 n=1 Tax=Streptomyces tanashiensis TaxID=67367 RepID=UPI0016723D43|nr:cytochrome P450 [Streptomyces tanashiensis]GGS82796.1 cytochrome P450 [Streptomyces tanashiensis]